MKNKIMLVAILALLMMSVPATVLATTFDINGDGSGYLKVETHINEGGSELHDVLTVNAWDWSVSQSVYTGSLHIDRTVNMIYQEGYYYTNQAEFLTTYDDGSTAITTQNFITSTYPSGHAIHGQSSMTQNYDADSSVGSYVMASSGRFPTTFYSALRDGSTFNYQLTHTTTNAILDETWSSYDSGPIMDFGSARGSGGQLSIYASSSFTTNVDGLLLLGSVSDMFGFNPTIADQVDAGTRSGTHVEFQGTLLDATFSIPYAGTGHLNHESYPVGFTIAGYVQP